MKLEGIQKCESQLRMINIPLQVLPILVFRQQAIHFKSEILIVCVLKEFNSANKQFDCLP